MKFISLLSVLYFVGFAQAEISIENNILENSVRAESSRHYYNFGRVQVNSYNSTSYTIRNTGTTYLQYSSSSLWGIEYQSNHNCFSGIHPGQSCEFQIRYWPFNVGMHSGQFEIRFYGPNPIPETIHVDLWGEAFRY